MNHLRGSKNEKIKIFHMIKTKWSTRIHCHAKIFTICSQTAMVRESMLKKHFKTVLIPKLLHLKEQGSH